MREQRGASAWIEGDGPFPASETLACRNGLVHLPSLVAGVKSFHAAYAAFLSPRRRDFDFNPAAPRPSAWLDFLAELWPDDSQSVGTLQEWAGYLLTPDTRQQKIMILVGPKRSGKGTISRIVRGLIGDENVTCPTLSGLSMNFGLQPLLGKNRGDDPGRRLGGRTDSAVVAERLLSISGEDAQTIDRKFLPAVTAAVRARVHAVHERTAEAGRCLLARYLAG